MVINRENRGNLIPAKFNIFKVYVYVTDLTLQSHWICSVKEDVLKNFCVRVSVSEEKI